ncbi:MAG: hypothetical protein NPINA01_11470 [Nitrospinaceae bacterium]|nr:MAG: hypothetical protein NPINA01_11470 [Nitrospinaceae bacterium]
MSKDREFEFKKVQIESYLKAAFQKKFGRNSRISIRKRQKFMDEMTRKVSKKFGKDVLCLVDFTKQGFVTLVSPARKIATDKGKLTQSFTHPQVFYTSHCIDRFSQRTNTEDNCVLLLDAYMDDALLSYGEHEGNLTCPAGVFAYEMENERLVVKTFINFELLSAAQIKKFYGPGMISTFPEEFLSDESMQSDFIMGDEFTDLARESQEDS